MNEGEGDAERHAMFLLRRELCTCRQSEAEEKKACVLFCRDVVVVA